MTEPESEREGTTKFPAKEADTSQWSHQCNHSACQCSAATDHHEYAGTSGFITHLSESDYSPENLEVSQEEGIRKKLAIRFALVLSDLGNVGLDCGLMLLGNRGDSVIGKLNKSYLEGGKSRQS